jgi:hypothetical protein
MLYLIEIREQGAAGFDWLEQPEILGMVQY